jgi:hypothetical protein
MFDTTQLNAFVPPAAQSGDMTDAAPMTSHIYQSAFTSESTRLSASGAVSPELPPTGPSLSQDPYRLPQGSLAAFICRVAYLENKLQPTNATFFDSDHEIRATSTVQIGVGVSFSIKRGTLLSGSDVIGHSLTAKIPKYVAIKRVKESPGAL